MLKDIISSIRRNMEERLRNPVLGAYAVSWVIVNWKIPLILFFSENKIENKITTIQSMLSEWWIIFLIPLGFTGIYLLGFPWLLLFIQNRQKEVNAKREDERIESKTRYLTAKIALVRKESELNEVRLEHQLRKDSEKRNQELELESRKSEKNFEIERKHKELDAEIDGRKLQMTAEQKREDRRFEAEEKREDRRFESEQRREDRHFEGKKFD